MEIVLYQPEIAGNVGACIRLSANTNVPLNIIKPLGFNFQENKIRRAGLDYHDLASVSMYEDGNEFKKDVSPREVRLKVFLNRDGDLTVPSLYGLFRGADWQERETFDLYGVNFEGHPHPKRLLMPEDWKGWPLRKDYIQPDFYEMQDAY